LDVNVSAAGSVTAPGDFAAAAGHLDIHAGASITATGNGAGNGSFLTYKADAGDVSSSGTLRGKTALTLDAGHDVVFGGSGSTGGDALLRAGNDIDATGALTALGEGTLVATRHVTSAGAVSSVGNLAVTAANGNVTTGTGGSLTSVGAALNINAVNGAVDLHAAAKAASDLTARSKGDLTTVAPAPLTATTGTISLDSSAGSISTGDSATAGTDILAHAAGGVSTAGGWSAGRDITATADTLDVASTTSGTMNAGRNVTLTGHTNLALDGAAHAGFDLRGTAVTGNITTGAAAALSAGSLVDLSAAGPISLAASVDATTNFVRGLAGGDITTTAGAPIHAGSFVLLNSGGSVTSHGTVKADGTDVTANAALDVTADNDWTAARDILGTAGRNALTTGTLQAGQDVKFNAGQDVTSRTKGVSAGRDLLYTAGTSASFPTGNITTETGGTLAAGNDVVLLAAKGAIALADDATAGHDLTAAARNSVSTTADAPVEATTGNVTLTSATGSVLTGGSAKAGADVVAHAAADVSADGAWNAGRDIRATADTGDVRANAPWGAGRDIVATASARDVLSTAAGDMTAGRSITITGQRHVSLDGFGTANTDFVQAHAITGNITTGTGGALTAGSFVDLQALAGQITLAAPVKARASFVQALANGDVATAAAAPIEAGTFVLLDSNAASVISHGTVAAKGGDLTANAAVDVVADNAWSASHDVLATAGQDVSSTLAGTMQAGNAITLDAGRNVDLNAATTATGDFVKATAGNSISTSAPGILTAGTSVTLDAGADITLAGNATARNQFIKATAGNDITTTTGELSGHTFVDLQAGSDIGVNASATAVTDFLRAHALGGNISTGLNGSLAAGSFVDLQALNGQIDLTASVTANGQHVQALAKGDITSANTAPVLANTSVLLDSSAGSVITHGTVTARTSDIAADAAVDVLADAAWSAGNDVLATAGHDVTSTTLGTITGGRRVVLLAGNDVTLDAAASATSDFLKATATNGDITTGLGGSASAGSFVDLQALNGGITLAAPVTARGDFVQALAKNDITTAITAPISAATHVLLVSSSGSVIGHGTVAARTSDITATAAADVFADAAWSAGNDILGTAGHDITSTPLGTMTAARNVVLNASNDITLHGDTTATAGDILGTAGHDILTTGELAAGTDVTLDAGHGITSGTNRVTAGRDITYHARTGDIATFTGALLTAGNDVLLTADHGRIDLRDDVTGKRDVIATAQNDITTFLGAPVTATNRNVTLTSTGGSILTQDLVKAGADLLADAAGDVTLTGGWQSGGNTTADAGGDINVRSTAAYGAAGLFTAGNDVAFTSTGALVKGGGPGDTKVIAGNNIGMAAGSFIDGGGAQVTGQAGHNIQLALVKTNFSGTNPDSNPAAVTLIAGTKGGGTITDLHTFSLGSGAVGTAGVVANGGGLDATAPNAINLGTQVDWVKARSQASGDLTLNEVDALHVVEATTQNGAVTITSGDTMIVRDVVAGGADALLRAYKNDIVVEGGAHQGSVTANGHKATLTAANSILGNTTWRNVRSTDLEATAGGVITLGTDVDNVVSTSGGKTTLHDFGSVTLKSVTTSGGDVEVAADGTITANTVRAGSGGGNNVLLTAGGDINKEGTGPNVQSNRLDAKAGGSIDLTTRVVTVNSLSNGNTTLDERDDLTLERVESKAGDIDVTTAGKMTVQEVLARPTSTTITLTSGSDIAGDTGKNPNVLGDQLITSARGTILLNTEVNTLTSDSTGNATFQERTDVGIQTVTSGGDVTLTALNGAITDANGAGVTNVTSKDLDVTAKAIDLDTAIDSLAVTGLGQDVKIREANNVDVNRLDFVAGNTGSLDLSVGRRGTMFMHTQMQVAGRKGRLRTVGGVDTKLGDQTYSGRMSLAGPENEFRLAGNNVTLNASVTDGAAHDLVINSTGTTTVHRDASVAGSITFNGDTTVEFDPMFSPRGSGATSVTVASGVGSTGGAAITFGRNASLIGMTQIISNGGSVTVGGVLDGDSGGATASVTTLGGNVEFQQAVAGGKLNLGINTELATHLTGDSATDADKDNNGSVRFSGPVDVAGVDVKAGNIYVMDAVTARTGDVTLVPDNRMNVIAAGGQAQAVAGVPAQTQYYASPKGHIELHGDLTASNGSITLGSELIPALSTQAKPLTVPPTADGQPNPGIPSVATIVAFTKLDANSNDANYTPIELAINAKNEFKMFAFEKMTVLGNVTINANHATLSDIAALGSLTVRADGISFATRDPSLLLTNADVVGGKPDRGLDFFANDGIQFVGRIDGAGSATGDNRFTLGVGPDALADVQGYRFLRASERSTLDKFFVRTRTVNGDPIILDATANGASSTDISVTITQALPQETPKPTEDTNLSAANQRQLVEMGIYARDASDQEIVDRVSGRVVYLDLPPSGVRPRPEYYTVVAGKLPQLLTSQLIEDDKKLVDANSTDPEKAEPGKQIRDMLTAALAAFNKANDYPDRIDPVTFRTFLADGNYKPARDMLDKFDDLLHRVEVMGLTEKQIAFYREKLVKRIMPKGIAVDEMYDVIRARPAERALTSAAADAPARSGR
jgi:filamentous hemagglutinin